MHVLDSQVAGWFLLQEGGDLFLDVNCNNSFVGYSVLIRLTPEEVAEYRAGGRAALSRLADRVQETGPPGEYQKRHVSSIPPAVVTEAVAAWRAANQDTAWLAGTRWYVPAENLLAYMTDPELRARTSLADQTLWNITSAAGGRFQGTSQTQLWISTPGGGFTPMSSASNTMDGTVDRDGAITIVFTPGDADQAQTVGYGWLRRVNGPWRMEMQMATGAGPLVMHWAYMTQAGEGDARRPPAPGAGALDGTLRSDEWRWLPGTTWSATDTELFPDGTTFTVGGYRNGYFWAEGETRAGSGLRMTASVTPEGNLYLLFSVADAPAVARRGTFLIIGQGHVMVWSAPSGGSPSGRARPVQVTGG